MDNNKTTIFSIFCLCVTLICCVFLVTKCERDVSKATRKDWNKRMWTQEVENFKEAKGALN